MNDLFTPSPEQLDWILGYEQGYNELTDVITQSADGADLNAMWREFRASVALLNKRRDPLINLLTYNVTNPTERVLRPVSEDFEEASEFGEPVGIRMGRPTIMGYDFRWYDIAIRYTWLFLLESSADQIRAINSMALDGDKRLVFNKVFRTIFNPTNSAAVVNDQNVTVYRLYNADGVVPPSFEGTDFSGSHTHYLGSNAAVVDSGDLDDMEEHLWHHGYRTNLGYDYLLLVNRQEGATIRRFRVADGDKYDFIPGPGIGGGVIMPPNGGIVGQPTNGPRGLVGAIGTYGPWVIVEQDLIPAGYMLGFASGGEQNIGNLVGIREHEQVGARGLRLVKGPDRDYPLTDSFYQHGMGTGVRHRGGGVVMQVHASTSYSPPTIYA